MRTTPRASRRWENSPSTKPGAIHIGFEAFANNRLKSLTLGGSVSTIDARAFFSNQLSTITFDESVANIGYQAFSNNNLSWVQFLGLPPTTFTTAGVNGSFGDGTDLTIYYPAEFDSNIYVDGYTAPIWNGYAAIGGHVAGAFITSAPIISGTVKVGSTLTVSYSWIPTPSTKAYQWLIDDVPIMGATSSSYSVGPADLGKKISVAVTGKKAAYVDASATSAQTIPVGAGDLTGAIPTISSASPAVGDQLTASAGTWAPAGVAFTYQWAADAVPIPGAQYQNYLVRGTDFGKKISVTVTGAKSGYASTFTTSIETDEVIAGEFATTPPIISGAAQVGSTLAAANGSWAMLAELSFQWLADNAPISGAEASTYTLVAADEGKKISVTVTGSALGYQTASITSAQTAAVAAGTLTKGAVSISGVAKVGSTLTATSSPWSPAAVLSYQWLADGVAISGANGSTYSVGAADLGAKISVTVTGALAGYTTVTATSAQTTVVAPGEVTASRISGIDRYETAAEIAKNWTSASVVYIANGLGFPDALSAGPLAAYLDAPLLLTGPAALPAVAKIQLERLQPGRIVIVGGTGVVSAAVEAELNALGFDPQVDRIGGDDRYETSRLLVADAFGSASVDTAYLANGANFPDALTASPAAAHFDGPVILVPGAGSSVDAATLALLDSLGVSKVKIAGGTGVVSAAIQSQLNTKYTPGKVTRNGGTDRYATAVEINADEFTSASTVYLATGTGFADALAGAALAGSQGAPLFVSQPTCIPQAVADAIESLGATSIVLLGGTGVLTAAVANGTVCH